MYCVQYARLELEAKQIGCRRDVGQEGGGLEAALFNDNIMYMLDGPAVQHPNLLCAGAFKGTVSQDS